MGWLKIWDFTWKLDFLDSFIKLSELSIRIHLKNTCIQFTDKYLLDHLCNYLITKYNHAISIPIFSRPVCAKLGVDDNVTYC